MKAGQIHGLCQHAITFPGIESQWPQDPTLQQSHTTGLMMLSAIVAAEVEHTKETSSLTVTDEEIPP